MIDDLEIVVSNRLVTPLAKDDDTTLLPTNSFFNQSQDSLFSAKIKRKLRYQAHLYIPRSNARPHSHEAGMLPHNLHQTNTILMAMGLHVGTVYGFRCLLYRCREAETAVDNRDVVRYGFGDCAYGDWELTQLYLFVN